MIISLFKRVSRDAVEGSGEDDYDGETNSDYDDDYEEYVC